MYLFNDQDVLHLRDQRVHAVNKWGCPSRSRRLRAASNRVARRAQRRARFTRRSSTCPTRAAPAHDGHGPREPGGQERGFLHARTSTPTSFTLAPGRKIAYGLFETSAGTSSGSSIWSIASSPRTESRDAAHGAQDEPNGKASTSIIRKHHRSLRSGTYQYLRTITLDGDMTRICRAPDRRRGRRSSSAAIGLQDAPA